MPRKQRVRVEEDEEDDELPSDLVPSRKIARKLRKQRLKDEDEDEDDELPSGLLPSSRIARKPRKQGLKDEAATDDGEHLLRAEQQDLDHPLLHKEHLAP